MRTITVNTYKIDELSGKAQRRAYEHWLKRSEYPWHDDNVKTLREFEKIFPIKIKGFEYSYEYGEGRNYIHFTFTEDENIENLSGIRLLKYIYNNYFDYISSKEIFYGKSKIRKSKIIYVPDYSLTGYCMDEEILGPIYKFLKKPEDITFYTLIRRCLYSWLDACRDDLENYFSFRNFLDIASVNKWEYLENGDEANVAIF
ncbi:MAG: PRiA4b ORF-3-like protein [Thermoanaerobacterium thermosaccharolyticum]